MGAEKRRLNVFEMKCLRPVVGVTRWDRNGEFRRRAGIKETLAENVCRKVLGYLPHRHSSCNSVHIGLTNEN